MARAVELALTPALMGGLGLLLDRWLGTWPVFAIFFFLFTIGYVAWKMFVRYDQDMRAHEAKLPGHDPGAQR
jgi:F0F1-type ATP synthase assembly protein I